MERTIENIGNRYLQERRYEEGEEQLIATLSVATIRKDTNFTCRIETDPPEERSMQVTVRGGWQMMFLYCE